MASKRASQKGFADFDAPLRALLESIVKDRFGGQTAAAGPLKLSQAMISEMIGGGRGIVSDGLAALLTYDKEATLRALGSDGHRHPSLVRFLAYARKNGLDNDLIGALLSEPMPIDDPGVEHFAKRYRAIEQEERGVTALLLPAATIDAEIIDERSASTRFVESNQREARRPYLNAAKSLAPKEKFSTATENEFLDKWAASQGANEADKPAMALAALRRIERAAKGSKLAEATEEPDVKTEEPTKKRGAKKVPTQ